MDLVLHESIVGRGFSSPVPLPTPVALGKQPPPPPPPPSPPPPPINKFGNGISPSILLIIVILAVIFFVSGLLHLLVRYLLRAHNRDPEEMDNATALQGQLQQLFHLHDAGVDQTFIDSLPVFLYKAIVGVKDPFDCAVCLCEFEAEDKLRLLPKCSHAFHLECIDTWLLSHSTCPLCRRSLLSDFSSPNSCSPFVLVLESGSESSREIASERGDYMPSSYLGYVGEDDFGPASNDTSRKSVDISGKEEVPIPVSELTEAKVVPVKLGKLRSVEADEGGEGTSKDNSITDRRRCFSMGSYEYVMDESSLLQVAIKPPKKKPTIKKFGNRLAMSEYDGHSRREGFKGFDAPRSMEFNNTDAGNASIGSSLKKKESFSVSKTWLRAKKEKPLTEDSSRRAFSFRLPLQRAPSDDSKLKRSTSPVVVSEFHKSRWENSGSELELDLEAGSCGNGIVSRADEAPSFARRTLLWIAGLHSRVGNHL